MKLKRERRVVIAVFDSCPRCGETHEELGFEFLAPPMDVGGVEFTHWALCPSSQTPILLKVDTLAA